MKVLVIGGNPAGMSAASRIKRKEPKTEVLVLEKSREVSYGACGLPYYVAGLNDDLDCIRIRKVHEFEESGIKVEIDREVINVDVENKSVTARNQTGEEYVYGYDKLLITSGTSPKVPPIPGIRQKNIYCLKTLQDAENIKNAIQENKGNIVIVGGGYIGLEIAEACVLQKVKSVRIVEALDQVLNVFDAEFGQAVRNELEKNDVTVCTGERVLSFEGNEGTVTEIVTDKGRYSVDLVILSIGVSPNTQFIDCVDKLPNGAIITNTSMESSAKDIYAAGDCSTVYHKILKKPAYIALGTYANKLGRLAGDSIIGKKVCFDRALGTSMLRCLGMEFGKTGISEKEAVREGLNVKTKVVKARNHARYYPNPTELVVKYVYDAEDHTLLGAQIMGEKDAAWRIDVCACAIDQGMTTEELGYLDLGYAPMFAGVWDAVSIAANASK